MEANKRYKTKPVETPQADNHPDKKPCKALSESAASRVLGTYELLEQVVLELHWIDTLGLRRVNKYWNDVVIGSSSPKMQQHLFLAAEPKNDVWKAHLMQSWSYTDAVIQKHGRSDPDGSMVTNTAVCSVLNNQMFSQIDRGRTPGEEIIQGEYVRFTLTPDLTRLDLIHREMFLCQPPATSAQLRIQYWQRNDLDHSLDRGSVNATVEREDGVRLRDILEAFQESICETKGVSRATFRRLFAVEITRSRILLRGVISRSCEYLEQVEADQNLPGKSFTTAIVLD